MRAATLLLLVAMCACAPSQPTTNKEQDVGRIRVREVMGGPKGTRCGVDIDVDRGLPPPNARVIAELAMKADKPEPLHAFEVLAKLAATRRCADGVRVKRAIEERGGIIEASVVIYVIPDDVVDAGPAPET